jgi:putative FmdB family regulatory protein
VPTYEYACRRCGEHLEVVQSFHDDPLSTCPSCAGDLRKVFGAVGITFKGSGFYKTDSRNSSSRPAASGTGAGSSPAESSSASSAEAGSSASSAGGSAEGSSSSASGSSSTTKKDAPAGSSAA